MKIAVIGAGAIGGLVAGYLQLRDEEVTLVARQEAADIINRQGLLISGVRGDFTVKVKAVTALSHPPEQAIFCTKTQDIEEALKPNLAFLKNCKIVATQNGIRAEEILARHIPKENIISSIVMFGATYLQPGKVAHNFEGSWVVGNILTGNTDEKLVDISRILEKVAPVVISDQIKAMKYLKIFVNANNCILGILGQSLQEAFANKGISKISVSIWKEGFEIISKAGIELVSLPGFPLENVTKLAALKSDQAAEIFSGIMAKLSKDPLYGSILQSIMRGRTSEIDYINGEFVKLAQEHGMKARLNEKLVSLVHEVEATGKFFSPGELLIQTQDLLW